MAELPRRRTVIEVIGKYVPLSFHEIDGVVYNDRYVDGVCPFCGGRLIVLLDEEPQRWICKGCLFGGDAMKFLTMLLERRRTEGRRGVMECDLSDSGIP